jgi:hypothetical protein
MDLLITRRGTHTSGLAEEMPHAYKDVAEVVETKDRAGISKKWPTFALWESLLRIGKIDLDCLIC